jgi:uncharacterized protein YpbB
MISFPSASVAPSIYTDFINGVRFDICEVDKAAYNMLNDKKFRFFLCVEESTILGYASAEKFCKASGEDRWDMFCKSMAECKALITKFEESYNKIIKLEERAKKSKSLHISCTNKIQAIKKQCIDIYGIYPTL